MAFHKRHSSVLRKPNLRHYYRCDYSILKYDKQDQQGKAAFITQPPYDQVTRTNGKEPRRTPNKNRTGLRQKTDRLMINNL
jgi:hypothetical protein